jgi:GTP cyclohydrolase I
MDHLEPVLELRRSRYAEPRHVAPADWERYERHVAEILAAFGMDLDTRDARDAGPLPPGAVRRDRRLRGRREAADRVPERVDELAPRRDRRGPDRVRALCEHHALPFTGAAHLAYVADEQIIGISKLTRLVRLFARRFTVQERLGEQIADALGELIEPRGVAVHLTASHLCTQMRGVEEHSRTVTTHWRGAFEDAQLRSEFLAEVRAR